MSANGAVQLSTLDLGDLSPDTITYRVTRNGIPAFLEAYKDGPRCLGIIKAKVQKARNVYHTFVYRPVLDELGNPQVGEDGKVLEEFFEPDEVAWMIYLRDVLLAVIPGLTFQEAEVLAGQEARALSILQELSWVRLESVEPNPEAQREESPSTTENSSRNSLPPTVSPQKSSSTSRGASSRHT